ncbi:MAG: molybdopterin-dependent oxidoreductase [Atribacterota bacterium]|nr:molybdopterin-dependent oxidoreductase [Atribacterota bacterium]
MKINRIKIGILFLVLSVLLLGSIVFALEENTGLTIINGDQVKTVTLEEIKEMPFLEDWGGKMRSTGAIEGPFKYKGVSLVELCNLVGGITLDTAIRVTARDGYAMTFSYKQVAESDFITYDPVSKKEVPHQKLQMILAYEEEEKTFTFEEGGPFKVAILSARNQVTDGHWWVKWIEKIEIVPTPKEWTLHLKGAMEEDIDRGTFESGSAEGCHGVKWADNKGREWEGIPLWLLVGRIDDENQHEDHAFNDGLVQEGYQVKIVASDGYSCTFPISAIARKNDIIVAYKVDGQSLPEEYWPLRVVGEGLTGKDKVGQISEISLIFP